AAQPVEEPISNAIDVAEEQPIAALPSDELLIEEPPVDDVPRVDSPVDERLNVDEDIEEVIWVSTNDDDEAITVISFGDDVAHREAVTLLEETSEPTVAAQTDVADDAIGMDSTLSRDAEQDESATMDEPSSGTNLPADKLGDLLATWRRGAYDVAFVQPVVPVTAEPLITPVIEVIDNADPLPIVVETAVEEPVVEPMVEVETVAEVLEPIDQSVISCGIEALEMTFSMVPTGASEMTLRAESTNHGELGCLPIHLEMAMLVSAMRGMQAETPGPDATDGLRALLETKSSSANDNTALRLRIGSLDAPRIDATLHGDGICHVRAGETRGDTQVSISAPDGGTSSIVATTSLAPMDGRAVITLEREVLRRPYGDVRYINRIRLQLMK
ncbi:MAG: hypothetical protein RJB05_146, partial [Armatimonadota bacterium]